MLRLAILGVAVLLVLWAGLFILARRLPAGMAREAALFIPHAVVTVKRLMRDPRVPRRVKFWLVFAAIWAASPIDLIPEFLPVVGPLDDLVVVALCLRYAARHAPRGAITDAWPGDPSLLERLLGAR